MLALQFLFTFILCVSKTTTPETLFLKEEYIYNNKFYHFNALGARWDEAKKICQATQRHIANPLDYETAQFLAHQITKSMTNFQRMWIGGRKKSSTWIWTHNDENIPLSGHKPLEKTTDINIYPPWDKEDLNKTGDCLSLMVNSQDQPIFTGWNCSERLSFICEDDQLDNSVPTLSAVEMIGDKEFSLYSAFLTWNAALSYCYEEGLSLATVESKEEVEVISKAMVNSSPAIENAWIGAYWEDNRWIWIHEGSELETSEEFPAWMDESTRSPRVHGCVLLDQRLSENATFINMKCDRQRSFVCMKKITSNAVVTLIDEMDARRYFLYVIEVTWEEALQVCKNEGPDVKMLTFRNQFEVDFAMEMMDDPEYSIRHIWVGGKAKFGVWWWAPDGEPKTLIPGLPNHGNFPPWCDNSVVPGLECLNLDRHHNRIPSLYGLECGAKQGVICVQDLIH